MALATLTLLVFSPTIFYGFVWDDVELIVENTRVQGLSPAHWRALWLLPANGQYNPVHHTTIALLFGIGGLNPLVYHLAQLALHTACVCLLYALLRRIESREVAAIAAALFAVHPANIENVAWIAEIKSTLAFLFFLLSFLFFHRQMHSSRRRDGILCVLFFALSILAKASTIVGPVVLLLYAWRRGAPLRQCAATLAALFAVALALTLLTLHFQSGLGALGTPDRLADATLLAPGASPLPANAGYYGSRWVHWMNLPGYLAHHLGQTLWPARLSNFQLFAIQPAWNLRVALWWTGLLGVLALIGWLWFVAKRRDIAFWMMWFLGFLAPVLQLVRNPIWVADRYIYIPAIGVFVLFAQLVAWAATPVAKQLNDSRTRRAVWAAPALAVLLCVWWTARSLPAWANEVRLWTNALRTCDSSSYCHGMLSIALRRQARTASGDEQSALRQQAVQEALTAVQLRATPQRFIWLGDALTDAGDPRAIAAYMKTQELTGTMPPHYWTLVGKAQFRFGNIDDAERIVASLQPAGADDPNTLMLQAFIDWRRGRPAEARQAVAKIMAMNTMYRQVPDRTLRFLSYYWGNDAEASRMLQEIQAP